MSRRRIVVHGKLLTKKQYRLIASEESCTVSTVLENHEVLKAHYWIHMEESVDIINIHNQIGLCEIEVRYFDKYYCRHCLDQREVLGKTIKLINGGKNWSAKLKQITEKYKGKINVFNIIKTIR